MTIPTFEGGGIPEPTPVPPKIPESPSIRFYSTTDLQALRQLASSLLMVPKGMLLPTFQRIPVPKVILQHQIITQLIAKFNPTLVQLAVLANKLPPAEKVEKQEQLPPKEASTQRDETTAKGLGHDLVNIEVFQAEKGENLGEQKFIKPTGDEKPTAETKEEKAEIAPKSDIAPKEMEKAEVAPKEVKPGIEPKEAKPEIKAESPSPQEKKAPELPTRAPPTENQEKQPKTETQQIQKPQQEQPVAEKTAIKQEIKPETQSEESQPRAPAQAQTTPKETEKQPSSTSQTTPVEKVPQEKEAPAVNGGYPVTIHHEEHRPIHKEQIVIIPHQIATKSKESTTTSPHNIFQTLDPDANVALPPWLSMLLPDLSKPELFAEGKRGGEKGGEVQHPHKLSDILFMLLCANLAGKHSLREAIPFIEKRENWFKVLLGLRHGLPPRQLLFWLLATLDATRFDLTLRRWLQEVQGIQNGSPILLDVVILQTPLGFIMGKLRGSEGKPEGVSSLVEGFSLTNFISLVKSEGSYESLLRKIRQRGAEYIAEVHEELNPTENAQVYESYLEGVERIVVKEWTPDEGSETNLQVHSEIFRSEGISKSERFYVSSLKNPNEDFFDLFRIQRPYESKLFWLMNNALRFPSIGNALERCNATLKNIEQYAKEWIQANGDGKNSVEQQMQKASKDMEFLLYCSRARN